MFILRIVYLAWPRRPRFATARETTVYSQRLEDILPPQKLMARLFVRSSAFYRVMEDDVVIVTVCSSDAN